MSYFPENFRHLRELIDAKTVSVEILTEELLNSTAGPVVWEARSFEGWPCFYPVYNYDNLYSFSPLALLIKKGFLSVNSELIDRIRRSGHDRVGASDFIDRDVRRIGSAHGCGFLINDVDHYANEIGSALIQDLAEIEDRNPGKANVVLCGGKDSLNLLLLPWKNKVIALSAEPNYPLVRKFIQDNELPIELIKLEDREDPALLRWEVLEACCRADLRHWRWSAGLIDVADNFDKNVIFWKGQVGDLYMAQTWMAYMHPIERMPRLLRRVYRRLSPVTPDAIFERVGRQIQPAVIRATWDRAASLQGSHMGFIRALTGCLALSAYHGPRVRKVWERADLATVARVDMRHKIGEFLLGRKIRYPLDNPAPSPSSFREGLSRPDVFFRAVKDLGLEIRA